MKKANMRYKEEGYHYFTLYAFAIIKNAFPNHKIYKSKKLKKSIKYALKESNYQKQLNINPQMDITKLAKKLGGNYNIYCFPYNSPAFELPYIIKQFDNKNFNTKNINNFWNLQKKITMDENGNLSKNTNDIKTLTARIYELLKAI